LERAKAVKFPKPIGIRIAKIALGRIVSPERADQLLKETENTVEAIKEWLRGSPQEAQGETTSPDRAIGEVVNELRRRGEAPELSDAQREDAVDLTDQLDRRLAELSHDPSLSVKEVQKVVESELPGRANTYVLWVDLPEIVKGEGGRYVHFSWQKTDDGVDYKVRDFIAGWISYPRGANVHIIDCDVNPIDLTAEDIWRSAKHRIPTVEATGLGVGDLGSVDGNWSGWKAVLNALTRNPPGSDPFCQAS
jgi:hypothetical protein